MMWPFISPTRDWAMVSWDVVPVSELTFMIYYPDAFLDNLLLEDIQYGDLTCRALNINHQLGTITFTCREAGCVSGITLRLPFISKIRTDRHRTSTRG